MRLDNIHTVNKAGYDEAAEKKRPIGRHVDGLRTHEILSGDYETGCVVHVRQRHGSWITKTIGHGRIHR